MATRFQLAPNRTFQLISAKRKDTKGIPSVQDIKGAIEDSIRSTGPGTRIERWVRDLYPVNYPSGRVVLNESVGRDTTLNQYEYTYEDGVVRLGSNPTKLEAIYSPTKNQGEDNFELQAVFVSCDSYASPDDSELWGVQKGSELRLVTGIVLEPETVDGQGDIYNAEEIRKTAHQFMSEYNGQGNGIMHKTMGHKDLKVVESFVAPVDMSIEGTKIKKGTWLMTTLVLDDTIWKGVKDGTITGYSIRGRSKAKYE